MELKEGATEKPHALYNETCEKTQRMIIERSLIEERTRRALEEATAERVNRERLKVSEQKFFWNDEKVR